MSGLRGLGSLQQLLGRTWDSNNKSTKNGKRRRADDNESEDARPNSSVRAGPGPASAAAAARAAAVPAAPAAPEPKPQLAPRPPASAPSKQRASKGSDVVIVVDDSRGGSPEAQEDVQRCPICHKVLSGTQEIMGMHVEHCLTRQAAQPQQPSVQQQPQPQAQSVARAQAQSGPRTTPGPGVGGGAAAGPSIPRQQLLFGAGPAAPPPPSRQRSGGGKKGASSAPKLRGNGGSAKAPVPGFGREVLRPAGSAPPTRDSDDGGASAAAAAAPNGPLVPSEARTIHALLVGRRFAHQSTTDLGHGVELRVERERGNRKDPNAVRCLNLDPADNMTWQHAGHLQRDLAGVLGPLMDDGLVAVECVVAENRTIPLAPLPLLLTIVPRAALLQPREEERQRNGGGAAAAAAAGGAAPAAAAPSRAGTAVGSEAEALEIFRKVLQGAGIPCAGPAAPSAAAPSLPPEAGPSAPFVTPAPRPRAPKEILSDSDDSPGSPVPDSEEPTPMPQEGGGPPPPLPGATRWDSLAARIARTSGESVDASLARGTSGEILRRNLLRVLSEIEAGSGHLISGRERELMEAFRGLPHDQACLFVRLWQRRGPWFRTSQLGPYPEAPDIPSAVEGLKSAGLLQGFLEDDRRSPAPAAASAASAAAGSAPGPSSAPAPPPASPPTALEALSRDDLSQRLGILSVVELRSLCNQLGLVRGVPPTREDYVDMLAGWVEGATNTLTQQAGAAGAARRLVHLVSDASGGAVRVAPSTAAALSRLQLVFFLSSAQDLSRFLVTDLGVVRYPRYEVRRTGPVFRTLSDLEGYEKALEEADQVEALLQGGRYAEAAQVLEPIFAFFLEGGHKERGPRGAAGGHATVPVGSSGHHVGFLDRFRPEWVRTMVATAGISLLEKNGEYARAARLLRALLGGWCCPGRRGHWWGRLALDLEKHLGKPTESLEAAEAALADEWVRGGDRWALERRVIRLGKPPRRWRKYPFEARASWEPSQTTIEASLAAPGGPRAIGLKSVFRGLDGQPCSVENRALQHYSSDEGGAWTGRHCENGIWNTLFGLIMWDVLFHPVNDVFQHSFQTAPLDLDSDLFFLTRRSLVEGRLAELEADDAAAALMLRSTWQREYGRLCRGVAWERESLEDMVDIATCLGGKGLAAILRLLASDHEGWSGGMPDLVLWRPSDRRAMLVEVKGPRDRLSDQQRAWLYSMDAAGVRVEVCKVREAGGQGPAGGREEADVGGE